MDIEATTDDITGLAVDAIVNAANEDLSHGGGVALAIAQAGAPIVDDESDRWVATHGPLAAGETAWTGAGSMPARWVIHVVGPRYRTDHDNAALLAEAVEAALDRAVALGARSVALPAISAGIFGYPLGDACQVIAHTVLSWADRNLGSLDRIVLCGFDDAARIAFETALSS